MGSPDPLRVDLFDDEIESLRTFDTETQRTLARVDHFELLPAKEFPLDDGAIARFRDNWHNTFNVDVRRCSIYQDISEGISPSGIEYYLPLFFDGLGTLFDYLPEASLFVHEADARLASKHFLVEVSTRYDLSLIHISEPTRPY